MSDFLLVPANVQAFLVGKTGSEPVYNPAAVPRTESEVAQWYAGNNVFSFDISSVETPYREEPLAQGVHLHWALPAALARSLQKGNHEPAQQPCIPNRWLVARMWRAPGNQAVSSKAWVVESDYVSRERDGGGTPFPFIGADAPAELTGNPRRLCGYVGRTVPAKDWKEEHPSYRFELNSLGWGDPSFSAYYPACARVLGFHDRMEGLAAGTLVTYLVAGWYSDPARDPLQLPPVSPYTIETCTERRARLGWVCEGMNAAALPRNTLCHGSVVGITWQGVDIRYEKFGASKAPAPGEIAIGGTAAEALAALLKPGETEKSIQQVLCAFQHGQATQVSRLEQLGDLLHRHGFATVPGGTRWVIEPPETPVGSKPSPPPPSDKVQSLLAELNQKQQLLDRRAREIESLRSRLFACWATWASQQTGPEPNRPERKLVDPAAKALREAAGALGPYRTAVDDCKRAVTGQLTAEQAGMRLAQSTMPPFLQPKDPFVVLKAENLMGVDRARAERPLPCRLAGALVTGVRVSAAIGKSIEALNCFGLPDIPDAAGPGAIPRSLALETLLFDPNDADLVPTGLPKPFASLQESLDRSRGLDGDRLEWLGQPPDRLSVTRQGTTNPWLPVYLMWQAHWAPTYDPKGGWNEVIEQGWKFDSGNGAPPVDQPLGRLVGDLIPKSPLAVTQDLGGFHGVTLLSRLTGEQLAGNLKEFTGQSIPGIQETTVLGQALGGFNDLLLRQGLGLFLPPFDPESGQLDDTLWEALGRVPQPVMPVEATFLPLRAGALKLVNLWVLDSFGQIRKLLDDTNSLQRPQIIVSAVLPSPPSNYDAALGPRLVQPARLNFDWQPAGDKSPGPVCGWVVPNYLEKNLAIFSAGGTPLGTLETALPAFGAKSIHSPVEFRWRPIPGADPARQPIANERLRRFVDLVASFTRDEGQHFLELVDLVLRRAEEAVPAEDPALAVLLGRPMALVHASVGLEVAGLPAGYWSEDWSFATDGFGQLRIPVRLGGMNLPGDGLVGYLPEGASCFVAADGALERPSHPKLVYRQDLKVACADDQPVSITMLMDAGSRVHASTGILPRVGVVLPREAARQSGQIAEIYVDVAPVLVGRVPADALEVTMPQPSDAFGHWSWGTRPNIASPSWRAIHPADDRARFAEDLALTEGWLRLRPDRGGPPPVNNR